MMVGSPYQLVQDFFHGNDPNPGRRDPAEAGH